LWKTQDPAGSPKNTANTAACFIYLIFMIGTALRMDKNYSNFFHIMIFYSAIKKPESV
jgi:hypothetical protein